MNSRIFPIAAAIGSLVLASCYPYDESQDRNVQGPKPEQKNVSSAEQQKLKEQREEMKKRKESASDQDVAEKKPTREEATSDSSDAPEPPVEEKRTDYKVANKVPGKDGFVFSPYNNKIIDVRDMPTGTLVQDPTYTGAGKGYFRVP